VGLGGGGAPGLECGNTLPLFHDTTCRVVPRRGLVRALQSLSARLALPFQRSGFDSLRGHFSLSGLNTGNATAFARSPTEQIRADAERLSHIVLEMQRCFVLHLCKELAPGNVSFPQFFLLAYLDQKEVLTMSAIAQKMGHTTAAASGLVARLENLGYVMRSVARDDRRKVMVCITPKGSALVRRIREEMVGNLMKILEHLTPDEQKAWLHIYSKIYDYCQSK
jgi:DNA-binding MarR family transcriptional regulator